MGEDDAERKANKHQENERNHTPYNIGHSQAKFFAGGAAQEENTGCKWWGHKGHLKIDAYHHGKPQRVKAKRGCKGRDDGHNDEQNTNPVDEKAKEKDDEHD